MFHRAIQVLALTASLLGGNAGLGLCQSDPLASWNDGAIKTAIADFVSRVTVEGGTDYVRPADRIAVFDNDGTLWAEQPFYFQFLFTLDRVKSLASQHPEWSNQEPFASVLQADLKSALAEGEHALLEQAGSSVAGLTTDEYQKVVAEWLATAKHPTSGKPFTDMTYQPMVELLPNCAPTASRHSSCQVGASSSCVYLRRRRMA